MIFHIMFYRNMISFSVNHNFSSAYSALSDTVGGHFWASKLLRTCSLFKVTDTNIHLHFMLAKSLRSHSLYNYARYILSYIKIV